METALLLLEGSLLHWRQREGGGPNSWQRIRLIQHNPAVLLLVLW